MMNDKEFAKAQASIMNKKTKLVQLKDDRAEACKKINEIEQEIAKTENELLEEERPTDIVDEVLLKVIDAPAKKVRCRNDEARE